MTEAVRPTLRTIAYLSGLGVSTVSRALKDGPEINAETRARVKSIAEQIGYRPNRAGVRLKTGKTNVISVVLNAEDGGSGFFTDFVYGISERLKASSYHLVVTPYSNSDPMEPVRYIVETASADGVILSRTQPHDPRVRYLMDSGIAFATHGRTELAEPHPYYDYDNEAFAFEAVRLLAERGRKRVVLLGPPPDLTYHKHTALGFERGVRRFGLTTVPLASCDSDSRLGDVRVAGRTLASDAGFPDGAVCSSTSVAVALAAGYADAGRVIGRDFDLVSKQQADLATIANPNILSIPEDFRDAGHGVADMVIRAINGEHPATLQRVQSAP